MRIKTLPLKLRKNGFDYTQVLRGRRTCIYAQTVSKEITYYEVFHIKISPKKIICGHTIEERERFPHDEAFGYWAWTFSTWERALEKYNQIEYGRNQDKRGNHSA